MKIKGNEKLNLVDKKEIVFYLGKEFSLESTNLFKIIPNINSKSYIINESGHDLQQLCPFYNVKAVFLDVENQLIDEAVYLFVQVNNNDLVKIRKIIELRTNSENYILINNPEQYYLFADVLNGLNVNILMPELNVKRPIKLNGVPKEENPFYYHNLFVLNSYIELFWGDFLEKSFGLKNSQGFLYRYFDNIRTEKKNELENLLKYKIPSKSIDLAIEKFKVRPLTIKENIEKTIMEGDYNNLSDMIAALIKEDNGQFTNIYDWIKYLECKAPNKVIKDIIEHTINSDDMIIDNRFLALIYEKLSICYQKEGDFKVAADVYRKFSEIENINGELKNVSSNFLKKEIELLYLAGEYKSIVDICTEEKLSILSVNDAPGAAVCIALAYNELGEYDKAIQMLKGNEEEKTFIADIAKLNKGTIKAKDITKQNSFSKIGLYNEMLTAISMINESQFLDTIKVFNRMKEILGNPQNLIGRRALLLVSLFKARVLKNIGNIRESLTEYYQNFESHYNDFEPENRSVVLEIAYEISELEKLLGNMDASLSYIEKGLSYNVEETSTYNQIATIKLLLNKLEVFNIIGNMDSDIVEQLDIIFKNKQDLLEFKPLKVEMNRIRAKYYLEKDRKEEALELIETSFNKYKNESIPIIELNLLDMLEMAKTYYVNSSNVEKAIIQLSRIVDKYIGSSDLDIQIRSGSALKELADYKFSQGDENSAMEKYTQLINDFSDNKYKKLENKLQDAIIMQSEIMFNRGKYIEARDSVMAIEGKLDSDIDASRELILAKCNEKLGSIELAISGYEEYLSKIEDKNIGDVAKGKVYKTLSILLESTGNRNRALEYIDRLLDIEVVPLARLETKMEKGRLLLANSDNTGYSIYENLIKEFIDSTEEQMLESLVAGCSKVASKMADFDITLYMDVLKMSLSKFSKLTKETKVQLFESMKIAARNLEEAGKIEDEKSLRKEIVKYFGDGDSSDYELESAYNYYRILEINLKLGSIVDLEGNCADYRSFFLGKEEDYVKNYLNEGLLLYGKEHLKRNEFLNAKVVLASILDKNKDMYEVKLYYGKALAGLGENKKALKEFKEIVDHDITGELFEAVIDKIKIIRSEKSIFKGNVKKLIKELEERIIPIVNTSSSNSNKISIGFELALLYKELKNNEKCMEILKGLGDKFSKYEDADIRDRLKVVYDELENSNLIK